MAGSRNWLTFKCFHIIEGEAEGRFAISALVALVLIVLLLSVFLNALFLSNDVESPRVARGAITEYWPVLKKLSREPGGF
jgi:hypothetical protein